MRQIRKEFKERDHVQSIQPCTFNKDLRSIPILYSSQYVLWLGSSFKSTHLYETCFFLYSNTNIND